MKFRLIHILGVYQIVSYLYTVFSCYEHSIEFETRRKSARNLFIRVQCQKPGLIALMYMTQYITYLNSTLLTS